MRNDRGSAKEDSAIEAGFGNDKEAHALLDLINAEFQSDPTSQQCFDSRIVERVKACVKKRKAIAADLPFYMV